MSRPTHRRTSRAVAATAVTALVCAGAASLGVSPASAADPAGPLTEGPAGLTPGAAGEGRSPRPLTPGTLGIPESGSYTFLVQLGARTVASSFRATRGAGAGVSAAREAAEAQAETVETAQDRAIAALPDASPVLYRTQNALAGFAVSTDVANAEALRQLPGVQAVYPVAPKLADNATAVPLQQAPQVWEGLAGAADGNTGEGVSIGVIDTGIDYTHSDFGGPGTVEAYEAANAAEAQPADPALFGPDAVKVKGGYDFAGDAYDADPTSPTYDPVPKPDANPLDCNGHGSHVSGSAAGLGVDSEGATYDGPYDTSTPFGELRVGPGMAPGADLYALRVFGCEGSTDLTAAAIDWAVDPDGDGDPSDHLDVINMSLGSAYGSPTDGDAVLVDAASGFGVLSVASAGNSGDVHDIGGSPGVAPTALTVASSVDAGDVVDALQVTIGGQQGTYGASRSVAYDWTTKPDLTGQAAQVSADDTGCAPYSAADAAKIAGKVAVVKWNDSPPECGSVARGTNIAAAGAIGFVFANSEETFSAGITGVPTIPGVLVSKSGGDAIRAALAAGQPVAVDGTVINGATVTDDEAVDSISSFTSRGSRGEGNLKPDVAAVGQGVFSAAVGTGDEGTNLSGTSMAAPMTAGLSALVINRHADWTPAQVKAGIVNTAGNDLYTNGSAADRGDRYAPNRVGSGRIDAASALDNDVLASVEEDPGAVSVSFGPVEATGRTTLVKHVVVENTGATDTTYRLAYDPITTVPGVSYVLDRAQVRVPAGETRRVAVTLDIRYAQLRKTFDVTHGDSAVVGANGELPLEHLADASGILTMTPTAATDVPALRVPVYSAPRPTARMTQDESVALTDGVGELFPAGRAVSNGALGTPGSVVSLSAGLELQAVSGLAPQCSAATPELCVVTESDRAADIEYVGTTTDQGGDPADQMLYFGVSAHAPASTPVGKVYYEVYLDTDGDLEPDLVAYTSTLTDDRDIFVVDLVDLTTGESVDTELLANRFGDLDIAAFDSEVQLLPVWMSALADYGVDASNPRVTYGVRSSSGSSGRVTDAVGFTADGSALSGDLSVDTVTPGLTATDADGVGPIVRDQPGDTLTITRDAASYADDRALGLMMVHFHNAAGEKTQVVSTGVQTITRLQATPESVVAGAPVALQVNVTQQGGPLLPGGTVQVVDTATGDVVAEGDAQVGSATLSWTPPAAGDYTLTARYLGDDRFTPSGSGREEVVVTAPVTAPPTTPTTPVTPVPTPTPVPVPAPGTKVEPGLSAKLTFKRGQAGQTTRVKVAVRGTGAAAPTGKVKLTVNGKKAKLKALRNGKVSFALRPREGVSRVRVVYQGDARHELARSKVLRYTAT